MVSKLGRTPRKPKAADFEQRLNDLTNAVDIALTNMNKQVSAAVEILNAVVGEIGEEKVGALIQTNRRKHAEEEVERQKSSIKQMVDAGLLVTGEAVDDESLVIGKEYDAKGEVVHPGWVQVTTSNVKPEFKDVLRGKKVGESFDTPLGKFEVLEIWGFNPAANDNK